MLKLLLGKIVEPTLARLKGETPLDKETEDKFRRFLIASCSEEESLFPRNTNDAKKPRQD
ncbi:MAG: hypothetical protein FJX23_09235 [Alphaproteobacteria bacterium]|nr:hypothetical protein [Alphaproteobacteria bacterium]